MKFEVSSGALAFIGFCYGFNLEFAAAFGSELSSGLVCNLSAFIHISPVI